METASIKEMFEELPQSSAFSSAVPLFLIIVQAIFFSESFFYFLLGDYLT